MNIDNLDLTNKFELKELKEFLLKFELEFDNLVDYTVVARENEEIVATVSKYKNIIKCFAIKESLRGIGLSNTLLTKIRNELFNQNYVSSKVFTKLNNLDLFEGMGYSVVSKTDNVILLEQGSDIEKVTDDIIRENNIDVTKNNAMIVMNCNPFTLGHRYLVEYASKKSETVLVFVLQENESFFPFDIRYMLAKKGVEDLTNVKVIPSTDYIISSSTFPTYFLKNKDSMIKEYAMLDSNIIATKFCKKMNITKRYLGKEPLCELTNEYNKVVKEIFTKHDIEVEIIDRLKTEDNETISASKVRKILKEGLKENLDKFLQKTTIEYLNSTCIKEIIENNDRNR